MENTANTGKRSKVKKWLLGGLGVLALGTLTYFGIDYYNKKKTKKTVAKPKQKPPVKKQATAPPKKTAPPKAKPKAPVKTAPKKEAPTQQAPKPEATFPLKQGDKGRLVKELKEMLITRFGEDFLSNELSKDTFDTFGPQLEAGLKDLKVPVINGRVILTQAKYIELMRPDPARSENLAGFFRMFINNKDFASFLVELKNIRNVAEYTSINSFYIKLKPYKSLLSAAFVVFTDLKQQQQLRVQFLRIGLKYDGQKWTLNGMKNNNLIITTQATTVWKDAKTSVPVPAKMVLGNEITRRGDFTLFENEGRHFLVESKTVKAYQP